jgi:hypothetical protein
MPEQAKSFELKKVFVGSWNAVKSVPEWQGKKVMEVYDKYLRPPYKNKEEKRVAEEVRPRVEKIVGWTATGIEAALITFAAVKGFALAKEKPSIVPKREPKKQIAEAVGAVGVAGAVAAAAELLFTPGQQRVKDALLNGIRDNKLRPASLEDREQAFLKEFTTRYTQDLRDKIHEGVIDEFTKRLYDQKNTLSKLHWDQERRDVMDLLMIRSSAVYLSRQMTNAGMLELNLPKMKKDGDVFPEVLEYTRVWRHMMQKSGLYDARAIKGKNLEDLLGD